MCPFSNFGDTDDESEEEEEDDDDDECEGDGECEDDSSPQLIAAVRGERCSKRAIEREVRKVESDSKEGWQVPKSTVQSVVAKIHGTSLIEAYKNSFCIDGYISDLNPSRVEYKPMAPEESLTEKLFRRLGEAGAPTAGSSTMSMPAVSPIRSTSNTATSNIQK